jgi:hypothetical protein
MGRQMKALIEAFACDLDLRPDLGADDPARTLICDAKNEFSTALIGQSAGIFGQAIKVVLRLPFLEFVVFAFNALENQLKL